MPDIKIISVISANTMPGPKRYSPDKPLMLILKINGDPSLGSGLEAPLGTIAIFEDSGSARKFFKSGESNIEWSEESDVQLQIDAVASDLETVTSDLETVTSNQALPTGIYVNNSTGSDTLGDGTSLLPYASIAKVLQILRRYGSIERYPANIDIFLANSGTAYNFPEGPLLFDSVADRVPRIRFRADNSFDPGVQISSATLTSAASSSGANGWVLTSTGAAWTVDAFRGKLVKITSGSQNGKFGIIYRNTADTLYVSPPYATNGNGYPGAPSNTSTISIRDISGATVNFVSDSTISGCNFWGLNITSTKNIRIRDKVQFLWCNIRTVSLNTGPGGWLELRATYVANVGDVYAEQAGMLCSQAGSFISLSDSVVIDGVNKASESVGHVSFNGSIIHQIGDTTFRDIGDFGIILNSCSVNTQGTYSGTYKTTWGFDSCRQQVRFNVDRNGNGGVRGGSKNLGLYNRGTGANGITIGSYICLADNGAHVQLDPLSNLRGASSDSRVSADAGVSNVSQTVFGTIIFGFGTPAATGWAAA